MAIPSEILDLIPEKCLGCRPLQEDIRDDIDMGEDPITSIMLAERLCVSGLKNGVCTHIGREVSSGINDALLKELKEG